MHELWLIGIAAGGGAAIGVAAAGLLARFARAPVFAAVLALVVAGAIAYAVFDWKAAIAGAIGGALGGFSAGVFARGAVRRGGTSGGTAILLLGVAVVMLLLALIPFVGYLEALTMPLLATRSRRRAGEKYAGLRTLAK